MIESDKLELLKKEILSLQAENSQLREEIKKKIEKERTYLVRSIQKFLDQHEGPPFGCGPDEA